MEKEILSTERAMLEKDGFEGWITVEQLRESRRDVPAGKGVYMVLRTISDEMPKFLVKGSGGFHKGVDKNYPVYDLMSRWVDGTSIMYIGKTDDSLRKRISAYIRHGQGKDASHRGGRSIWQLPNAGELVFVWKVLPVTENAEAYERLLIQRFQEEHGGKMPFANRQ